MTAEQSHDDAGVAPLFEFRIRGNVRPDTLRARDLASLITSIEAAVAATAAHDSPGIDEEEVSASLTGISDGSAGLQFRSNLPAAALAAVATIAGCVTARQYGALPSRAISALREIDAFARHHRAPIEVYGHGERPDRLAVIDPRADIGLPRNQTFWSDTELYGRLERLGGAKPRARLVRDNGEVVYCDLSESLARRIGHRIYDAVGLSGSALWDTETWTIIGFRAEKLLEYTGDSLVDGFNALREASQGAWDRVVDVDDYIAELRR